jgi:hypothetical protein
MLLGIAVTSLVNAVASLISVSTPMLMAVAMALAATVVRVYPTLRAAMWTCPVIFLRSHLHC